MAGVAERHGHRISFSRFARYGVPTVLLTLVLCSVYLWVRYLLPGSSP